MGMRLTDVAAGVPVFLLWIACTPAVDRAATNDGDACTQDTACDSRVCEVDGVCRGSSCEKDDGCREGWTCLRKSGFLGSTGTCVPGCDQCPVGRACQNGGTECLTIPVTVEVAIVEPPPGTLSLRVGEPVKLRATLTVTPPEKPVVVKWRVDGLGESATYEALEATHTFAKAGPYQITVTAIAGTSAVHEASVGVDVK
jgi:hypothetical protein